MAVISLLMLMACFIAMPYFYSVKRTPPVVNKALLAMATSMGQVTKETGPENKEIFSGVVDNPVAANRVLSPFDPNTLSEKGWISMGMRPKTAHTIMNYRNKGGRFRFGDDIRKIWGLSKADADRLIPFVQIADTERPSFTRPNIPVSTRLPIETGNRVIDINTATTEEWKTLPGIGEVLASRIVKFRERMGGFTDVAQVKKTYGISDSVFILINPWLTVNTINPPKLDLNSISAYELKQRANIPDAVAKAIVTYRQQYGPYQSVNDLKKIVFINDSLFQKMLPFLWVK